MKKYSIFMLKAFLMISVVSVTVSCSKWLNVKPSNQIAAEDLFSKEEGFKSALTGVYTLMSAPELYGREMTFGAMDYLGQYWTAPNQYSSYFSIYSYDFEDSKAVSVLDQIWNKQYNAIANINDMLAFIDVNKGVFSNEAVYSVIKGEALALRAFLHFDILRAYAPYSFDDTENAEKWLPYVTVYSKDTKESLSNSEFSEKILEDLNAALLLLEKDPVVSGNKINDTYFDNRIYHMNYYAVRALSARVHMYLGDKEVAMEAADEVIKAQIDKSLFGWVDIDDVTNLKDAERDRTFASEHIFALNVRRLGDNLTPFVGVSNTTNPVKLQKGKAIFEGETEYRERFVDNNDFMTKLNQPEDASTDAVSRFLRRMPVIRISEMYYIMAECTGDISYLNTVRSHRGIVTELGDANDFEAELKKEYEKEFIGEGQYFFFNKRKGNSSINSRVGSYTLIMPQTEIDFGGRPRPTI